MPNHVACPKRNGFFLSSRKAQDKKERANFVNRTIEQTELFSKILEVSPTLLQLYFVQDILGSLGGADEMTKKNLSQMIEDIEKQNWALNWTERCWEMEVDSEAAVLPGITPLGDAKQKTDNQLSPLEAASLRIRSDLTWAQYRSAGHFLTALAKERNKPLNILPSYIFVNEIDKLNLPSNVSYQLSDKISGEVKYQHVGKIEDPLDIRESFVGLGPGHPQTNIYGSYFKLTDILARELYIKREETEKVAVGKKIPDSEELTVKVKICEDGFGDLEGCPIPKHQIRPANKIFRANLCILGALSLKIKPKSSKDANI